MKYLGFFEEDFRISSFYGWRVRNGKKEFHDGVDIVSPLGRVIFSPFRDDGIKCIWQSENAGSVSQGAVYDRIKDTMDNKAIVTFHEDRTLVKKYDKWEDRKGYAVSGNTGYNTSGPHTHLSIEVNGKRVDPMPYLDTYVKNGETYLKGVKWNPQPPETCEQKLQKLQEELNKKDAEIVRLQGILAEIHKLSA